MRAFFVLDTNYFMHGKSLHQVQWLPAAQKLDASATEVVLAIPPVVLSELEKHKSGLSGDGLNDRARDALRLLINLFRDKTGNDADVQQQPGVSVRLLRHHRVTEGGEMQLADDRMLGALQELRTTEPDALVAVVTQDAALQLRSSQFGYRYTELDGARDWKTTGPRLRRQPDAHVDVLFESVMLSNDDEQSPSMVRKTVDHDLDINAFHFHRAKYEMRVERELAEEADERIQQGQILSAKGVRIAARDRVAAEEARVRNLARKQQDESYCVRVTLVVRNTGGSRLRDITVDPLKVHIGATSPPMLLESVEVAGRVVSRDGVGLNPTQVATFHFKGDLPRHLQPGTHLVKIIYAVLTETLVRDEELQAHLTLATREPPMQFGEQQSP